MFTGSNLSYTRNKLYNFLIKFIVTFKKQLQFAKQSRRKQKILKSNLVINISLENFTTKVLQQL